MHMEDYTPEELQRGYTYTEEGGGCYSCISCGERFSQGEIFPLAGRLYEARRAVECHIALEHPDHLLSLINSPSKYNTLTDNQRQLLQAFARGTEDKVLAKELGVSASTIRHQKFVFREKAKQARLYLAIYQGVMENREKGGDRFMPIHDNAKMVDERYVVTEEERAHVLDTAFSSLDPLKLKNFSPKEKKKIIILTRIAQEFSPGTEYSEKQVNGVLSEIYSDFATLRRYLIEYGFMQRTKDGARYWLA